MATPWGGPTVASVPFRVQSPDGQCFDLALGLGSKPRFRTTDGLDVSRIGPGHYRIHETLAYWFGLACTRDVDAYTDYDPIRLPGEE